MNNVFKTAVSCFLLSASLNTLADNDRLYLGLGVAFGSGSEEYESNGYSMTTDLDQDQADLKLGYVFPSQKRIEISFNSVDVEAEDNSDSKAEYSGFDIDWHFPFQLESNTVQPYLGVGFGFYDYEDTGEFIDDGDDLSGIAFNLMGGLLIPVNENIEFDIAYKIKSIAWQSVMVESVEVDTSTMLTSLALGVRFKF
jgi:opacity protein-like surface antigen